ncbi:ORF3 [Penicillium janczewskii chrysovirus 2]|uniref:ORF3 n=1 Tax=Penicillium janczewskii chrysovirus 2 TaxID=1755793 RepID=A0A0S2KPC0_9VIRU|nr:ORF3 [Penicillium janczewskii chrysovirus 2]ALO50151.1 ORF3 [Penicillium janczewskii chrysovirus 2]
MSSPLASPSAILGRDVPSLISSWADEVEEAYASGEMATVEDGRGAAGAASLVRADAILSGTTAWGPESAARSGLGATTLARATGLRRTTGAVFPPECEDGGHLCGIPFGPRVFAATWVDADIAYGSSEPMRRCSDNAIRSLLRTLDGSEGAFTLPSETRCQVYRSMDQHMYLQPDEGFFWVTFQVRVEAQLMVYGHPDGRIRDVAVARDLRAMRSADVSAYRDMLVVLAGIQQAIVFGELGCVLTVLHDCPLGEIKQSVHRHPGGGVVTAGHTGSPVQILDTSGTWLPTPAQLHHQRVSAATSFPEGTVAHGVVSASEVMPTLVVGLGANGGKSLTGSVLCVRVLEAGFAGARNLVTTSTTANAPLPMFKRGMALAPCARDGLLSHTCAAALYGDGLGGVFVYPDGVRVAVDTVLSKLRSDGHAWVYARDVVATKQYVLDLISLQQGWDRQLDNDGAITVLDSRREIIGSVYVLPGAGSQPRWATVLEGVTMPTKCGSELWLDHGVSGLGRYLLANHITNGRFTSALSRLAFNWKGPFQASTAAVSAAKTLGVSAGLQLPISYVVDTEFISRKGPDGNLDRYVFAVGVARFHDGQYQGSMTVVDTSAEFHEFAAANRSKLGRHMASWEVLQRGAKHGDPTVVLERLREVAADTNVRVYAKGYDAESEILVSEPVGATRLFRRQAGNRAPLRELGLLTRGYDELAREIGWPTDHDPGRECTLFGYTAGLCDSLPPLREIGNDSIHAVLGSMSQAGIL